MKTNKFLAFLLLAVLFAACGKDGNGHFRLFAAHMTTENPSKLLFDPAQLNNAEWVAGETLNINGSIFAISGNSTDGFSVDATSIDGSTPTLYAIYPGNSFGGNDVSVTNTSSNSGSEVVLKDLVITFRNDGKHEVVFPMATGAVASNASEMTFKHLTGGIRITLNNNSANAINLGSVKIVTYGDGATVGPIAAINGCTARWAVQGPSVPSGMLGTIEGDVSVLYSSEMHFTLKDGGNNGKTVNAGHDIQFCVPVTVSSIKSMVVTGYSTTGAQLFVRTKTFSTAKSIVANTMYNIPSIDIN